MTFPGFPWLPVGTLSRSRPSRCDKAHLLTAVWVSSIAWWADAAVAFRTFWETCAAVETRLRVAGICNRSQHKCKCIHCKCWWDNRNRRKSAGLSDASTVALEEATMKRITWADGSVADCLVSLVRFDVPAIHLHKRITRFGQCRQKFQQ